MALPFPRIPAAAWWLAAAALALVAGALTYSSWLPHAQNAWQSLLAAASPPERDGHGHGHDHGHDHGDEHGHDHPPGAAHESLELSPQALRNIGFAPLTLQPTTFTRTLSLPAVVTERPGRSQFQVAAPLGGIVTRVYLIEGSAIEPGAPLFDIRLTHEELASAQKNFLQTAESLDVVNDEIQRLKTAGEGIVAGKRVVEQEYERRKLEAALKAERQGLTLHGITPEQVDEIYRTRQALQNFTVKAPAHLHEAEHCREEHLFHMQTLLVKLGEQVDAGQPLCAIADHCELYVEGKAFEDDAARLRQALEQGWEITAVAAGSERSGQEIHGLKLLFLADRIDPESRAFEFYLTLANEVLLDRQADGYRFIHWRFRPGQRLELHVPVERWENRLVAPVEAVVDEGAESYVFLQDGDHFDRRPVHVEYRDRQWAVLASDGAVFPGDVIAARGAYQMHLALKNQAGGGVDPHAGHSH